MNAIMTLPRAVNAEMTKLKHNPIVVTVVLLPLVLTLLVGIASTSATPPQPQHAWMTLTTSMISFWSILLVFFVPMITAQLAALEHVNHLWKHLFALPTSRASVYLAKLGVGMILIAISYAAMFVALLSAALILHILHPKMGFSNPLPLGEMLNVVTVSYIGTLLITALHTWAAVRFQSFAPAIALGMIAFLISMMMMGRTDIWPQIFPWRLPSNFINGGLQTLLTGQFINWEQVNLSLCISVIGFTVVAIISAWDIARRDVG